MNQEILNQIMNAIKNNDMDTVDRLSKQYNIKISLPVNNLNNANTNRAVPTNNVVVKKINPSELVNNNSDNYFRGIPCNNDIFVIYYLASNHGLLTQDSNIFSAFLLRWLKEDKIKIFIKKIGFFKKKITVVEFFDNVILVDEYESKIYNFLKNISRNNKLDIMEFNNWLSKREFELNGFLNELKDYANRRLVHMGALVLNNNFSQNNGVFQNNNNTISNVRTTSFMLTPTYRQYLQQIVDFKKYIKEFSLIHQKDPIDVKLWGDYLSISLLLGIADEVSGQLNYLIPGFKIKKASRKKVRIKVPAGIPKNEIDDYIRKELENKQNNMFKF